MIGRDEVVATDDQCPAKSSGKEVAPDGGQLFCIGCGERIDSEAVQCPVCDTYQDSNPEDGTDQNEDETVTTPPKNGGQEDDEPDTEKPENGTPGVTEEYCSNCGAIVLKRATNCPHCGIDRSSSTNGAESRKNPIIAGILSFLIVGAGQVYNGQITRGIGFFGGMILAWIVTVITFGIGFLLVLAVWAYAVYDAYTGAKVINTQ